MPPAERSALYIRAYINIRPRYIFATLSPSQPVITGKKNICWETFLNFFAFFVSGTRMRRSGWYPRARSSQHLQVVTLHLKSWTSPPASFAFCSIFFLVSERGGRRKPPAERSALYTSTRHAHRHRHVIHKTHTWGADGHVRDTHAQTHTIGPILLLCPARSPPHHIS